MLGKNEVILMNHADELKKLLPISILEKGYYLGNIGINEYAWNSQDAKIVINLLVKGGIFILGGDVYSQKFKEYRPTGDNWYVDKSLYLPTSDELEESKNKSIDFIQKYIERNGENFLFTIVPDIR